MVAKENRSWSTAVISTLNFLPNTRECTSNPYHSYPIYFLFPHLRPLSCSTYSKPASDMCNCTRVHAFCLTRQMTDAGRIFDACGLSWLARSWLYHHVCCSLCSRRDNNHEIHILLTPIIPCVSHSIFPLSPPSSLHPLRNHQSHIPYPSPSIHTSIPHNHIRF